MLPAAIARYPIVGRIGTGGFATVYRARDPVLDRDLAIKVLHAHLAEDPLFRERFVREGRALARVRHPNLVQVHDAGEADGQVYLAMEFVPGRSLAEVARGRSMMLDEVVPVIRQVAEALDAVHAAGLVHRDVKPANILVTDDGRAVLLDLGIARTTSDPTLTTGLIVGTPGYLAPEQVDGSAPVAPATDIYQLGATVYTVLAGRAPFTGDTTRALFDVVHRAPPYLGDLRPDLPGNVLAAVTEALAKDPARRPPTAGAFARALAGAAASEPVAPALRATPPPLTPPTGVAAPAMAPDAPAAAPPPGVQAETAVRRDAGGTEVAAGAPPPAPATGRNTAAAPPTAVGSGPPPMGGQGKLMLIAAGVVALVAVAAVLFTRSSNGGNQAGQGTARGGVALGASPAASAPATAIGAASPPAGTGGSPAGGSVIVPGGPPVTVNIAAPGEPARLTFTGRTDQRVSAALSRVTIGDSTCCAAAVSILRPDGAALVKEHDVGVGPAPYGGFIDVQTLPVAGTYTLAIEPAAGARGSLTVTLFDVPPDVAMPITADGRAVTLSTTVPGQNAMLTFTGRADQRVSLKLTKVTIGDSSCCAAEVALLKPDGTALVKGLSVGVGPAPYGGFIDVQTLPVAGTYTIRIDPADAAVGGITVALFDVPPDVTATAGIGGPPVTLTTTVPGQNAAITFSGTAGQRLMLAFTKVSFGDSSCCAAQVSILGPDGTALVKGLSLGVGNDPYGGSPDPQTLPASGTYTVLIDPADAATGGVTVALREAR